MLPHRAKLEELEAQVKDPGRFIRLDAEFHRKSHRRIDELRQEAGTVFLVAHNLNEIDETCNRVIWLEKGQIVRAGTDVPGILDAYLAASGSEPRFRELRAAAEA